MKTADLDGTPAFFFCFVLFGLQLSVRLWWPPGTAVDTFPKLYRGAQELTQPSVFRGFQPDNGLFMKLFFEAPYGYSVMIGSCATVRSNVWLQQTSSAVDFVNVNDPIFESKA